MIAGRKPKLPKPVPMQVLFEVVKHPKGIFFVWHKGNQAITAANKAEVLRNLDELRDKVAALPEGE